MKDVKIGNFFVALDALYFRHAENGYNDCLSFMTNVGLPGRNCWFANDDPVTTIAKELEISYVAAPLAIPFIEIGRTTYFYCVRLGLGLKMLFPDSSVNASIFHPRPTSALILDTDMVWPVEKVEFVYVRA